MTPEQAVVTLRRFGGLVSQAALDRDEELSSFSVQLLQEALELGVEALGDWGPQPTGHDTYEHTDAFEAYFNVADEIYEGLALPRKRLDQTKSGLDPANAGLFGPEHIYTTLADLDVDWVATARRFVDEWPGNKAGHGPALDGPPWPPYLPWAEEHSNDLREQEFRQARNWEGV